VLFGKHAGGGLKGMTADLHHSRELADVCCDSRGPVLAEAQRMGVEGRRVIKLNIGDPAPLGFQAPDEILVGVIRNPPGGELREQRDEVPDASRRIVTLPTSDDPVAPIGQHRTFLENYMPSG